MKNLFYSFVSGSEYLVLVALDTEGCVYYASAGELNSQASMVELMEKDFLKAPEFRVNSLNSASSSLVNKKSEVKIKDTLEKFKSLIDFENKDEKIPYKVVFGTPLQRKVWDYLVNELPVGSISTYQKVAQHLGMPNSSRAIGNCVGANRIAVVIPCHRVIGSSGKITGYRYGTNIKKTILENELGSKYGSTITN
ncbi:hypothetical protein G9P44_002771 [Scheffersomyces stipitis]|nr:hypothetical protein G9P44_002771 [Scheffersomyces stipitis]